MIIRKLPYIIYREYPKFGYLTDNRNYGYDTANRSRLKVGDLLISTIGSVFYSKLSESPQKIDFIFSLLCQEFPDVPQNIIQKDALDFYNDLSAKGFIYFGEEDGYLDIISKHFSYSNRQTFELKDYSSQELQLVYENTLGMSCRLNRVHIDVSSRCNEKCVHCYIPNRMKNNIMSVEMFDKILTQCKEMNVINITISGGEPMLNPSLKEFLLKCKEYNFSINLLSNLTLMSDEMVEIFAENPLISIQTSLYAIDEDVHDSITCRKGSFQKTYSAIHKLYERNIPLQINCPIMKQNINHYRDVLKFAKTLNIEADSDFSLFGSYDCSCSNLSCRLSVSEIDNLIEMDSKDGFNQEKYNALIKEKKMEEGDPICSVCKNSLCISNTGDVYPCEGWQGYVIGSLENNTLKEIWEESSLTTRLRNLTYKDFPKCNSCEFKKYCSPCLIMNANEDKGGNFNNVNYFLCEIAKSKSRYYCGTNRI